MTAMKFTGTAIVILAISYLAGAAPLNVTNGSTCYCQSSTHFNDDIEIRTYRTVNDSLRTLYTYCNLTSLACPSSPEITCDACLPRINTELERLLGILHPLMEVCEDEEGKFFRGEQSLYDLCIAVDCEVKLSAQSVARYLMSNSERCSCEEDSLYVPGRCIEFQGEKNVTELFTALYDSMNSLRILFCRLQVYPPFTDLDEVCSPFPPNGAGDAGDQLPSEPDGSLN